MRGLRLVSIVLGAIAGVAPLAMACGARTGLELRPQPDASLPDSGIDAGVDSGLDAGDAADVLEEPDTFFPVDAIAPFDASIGRDSGLACADGGFPTAYLLDNSGTLYTFDPATLQTTRIGTPRCGQFAVHPWTLSVSREGNAYIVYTDAWLTFKVDLTTLACTQTPFLPGDLGIRASYSIAVSRTVGSEKLYVYGEASDGGVPVLASTDLTTFSLTEVGAVNPVPPSGSFPVDMQADLFGHLFGLGENGLLIELQAATAEAIGQDPTGLSSPQDWAIMTYEDNVYMFWTSQAPGAPNQFFRYDLASRTAVLLGTMDVAVLGASAVPCSRLP